jgi:hypothetical protein
MPADVERDELHTTLIQAAAQAVTAANVAAKVLAKHAGSLGAEKQFACTQNLLAATSALVQACNIVQGKGVGGRSVSAWDKAGTQDGGNWSCFRPPAAGQRPQEGSAPGSIGPG